MTRRKQNPFRNAVRLQKIVSVFARHGFTNLAERVHLKKFLFKSISEDSKIHHLSMPERMRISFEQLGPTFIKLGQLLASRPDLVPKQFVEEFKKLHSNVTPLSFNDVEPVLFKHFGVSVDEVFASFDREPLAAASIAQVHSATLSDGTKVVVKVQRPGIESIIKEDLGVLFTLAELLEKYVAEARLYNVYEIVDEFSKSLQRETDFIIEANNIRRFSENFKGDPQIVIPKVFNKFTGKHVLVMEALNGVPLSHISSLKDEIDREEILRVGLRCYLQMVFSDGLFHGDLHAGNMFILPDNKVGLIDFGAVGRLNRRTQTAIANMLMAIADEDYDRLAYEYIDMAPYTENINTDQLGRELRDMIAPYHGLTSKHVNVGKVLMDSTSLVAHYHLRLPSELILFFKSVVCLEGMGQILSDDFDFMAHSLEFSKDLIHARYEPGKVAKDLSLVGRDLGQLLQTLPRQLKQLLRKINSPNFSVQLEVKQIQSIKQSMETSSNIVFLGLIIGSLILSASFLVFVDRPPYFLGIPALAATGYIGALILGFVAFINYVKK